MTHTFSISPNSLKQLSLFVLHEIEINPETWMDIGERYRAKNILPDDPIFRWAFSRLISKMHEEGWIGRATSEELFEIGLTFKGSTVLRHQDEIDSFYQRHFEKNVQAFKKNQKNREVTAQRLAKKEKAAQKKAPRKLIGKKADKLN